MDGPRRTMRVAWRNLAVSLACGAVAAVLAMSGLINNPLVAAVLMSLSSRTLIVGPCSARSIAASGRVTAVKFVLLSAPLLFASRAVIVVAWAARPGRFDDPEAPAIRILGNDEPPNDR